MTSHREISTSEAPTVVLVTVTFNAASLLEDFWNSLLAQRGVDWSLVVVDNASVDGTLAKLLAIEADHRVTVIRCATNTGAAEGNNIGLRQALANAPDYVVLCNNDVLFGPDALHGLVKVKAALPDGAVSPLMVFENDRSAVWFEWGEISTRFGVRCLHRSAPEGRQEVYPTDYAPTTFLLFDRAVFDAVGELDSAYFAYWEDADYIWRTQKAGFGVWVDRNTVVVHKVSQSSGGFGSAYSNYQYFKNQVRFTRKHFGRLTCAYTILFSLTRIGVRAVLRRDTPELVKAKLRGLWSGVAVLLHARAW